MKRITGMMATGALFTGLSAQAAVIELDCEMQSDLVTNIMKTLPPTQAARFKDELDKRGVPRIFFTLDTEKRTLRLRWKDADKGGYQWRTIHDLQKRTLPDGVIAYTHEREEKGNAEGSMKTGKEMFLVAPEVKTVVQVMYAVTNDGQEVGSTTRGACK